MPFNHRTYHFEPETERIIDGEPTHVRIKLCCLKNVKPIHYFVSGVLVGVLISIGFSGIFEYFHHGYHIKIITHLNNVKEEHIKNLTYDFADNYTRLNSEKDQAIQNLSDLYDWKVSSIVDLLSDEHGESIQNLTMIYEDRLASQKDELTSNHEEKTHNLTIEHENRLSEMLGTMNGEKEAAMQNLTDYYESQLISAIDDANSEKEEAIRNLTELYEARLHQMGSDLSDFSDSLKNLYDHVKNHLGAGVDLDSEQALLDHIQSVGVKIEECQEVEGKFEECQKSSIKHYRNYTISELGSFLRPKYRLTNGLKSFILSNLVNLINTHTSTDGLSRDKSTICEKIIKKLHNVYRQNWICTYAQLMMTQVSKNVAVFRFEDGDSIFLVRI